MAGSGSIIYFPYFRIVTPKYAKISRQIEGVSIIEWIIEMNINRQFPAHTFACVGSKAATIDQKLK